MDETHTQLTKEIIDRDIEAIVAAIRLHAHHLEGKRVLLTGGAGFLGSYITAAFAALNKSVLTVPCEVIVLDNYITGSRKNLVTDITDPHINFQTHDVREPLPFDMQIDYLIHAAGVASPIYYKKYPIETIEGTIFGVKNILEYARKFPPTRILYFSSSEIYGDPDPNFIPTPETYRGNVSSVGPRACYDESKRLGETYCSVYHDLYTLPVVTVRPFNVYGPGMKPNDYRVVSNFLLHALQGKPLPVHDKGNQTRSFCYIADAVTGFLLLLLAGVPGEAYNVGNDEEEINMLALAEEIVAVCGGTASAQLVSYPAVYPTDEPRRRCPDLTKIREAVGFQPRVHLKDGLARTLAWFRAVLEASGSQQ